MNLEKSRQLLSHLNKSPLIPTSSPFKVSVIICAYSMERLPYIHEAVDSVLAQSLKSYEVIVSVDHNEELYHRLKRELPPEVKVILNRGVKGSAETRNVGIRFSTGDIVAFIDDDAIAEKDWLEHIIQHYQGPNVIAVGGQIVSVWSDDRPHWFPEELDWIVGGTYKGYIEAQTQIRNLLWPNMSFRREVCNQIGFIRTDLGALGKTARSGDETEFCMRISHHISGAIILHERNAIVYHKALPHQTTLKHLIIRSYNEGFYKAEIETTSADLSQNTLSMERSYLRYLLSTAIPQRLRYFYQKDSFFQVGAIMLSIAATGVGYLVGKLNLTRFLKYCVVGGLGVLINEGLLWLLTSFLGISYLHSALFGMEAAIVVDFNLNDRWTFGDRRHMAGNRFIRFLKYNLLIVGGVGINLGVLWVLTDIAGIYYLISNLFGIAAAVTWNYSASTRWAWKKQVAD